MKPTKSRPNNAPQRPVRTTGPHGEDLVQTSNTPPPKRERIGDILRRERERRGDDLHRIADYLCIKPSYLAALEDNDYDAFPADAYVVGFLRSYAAYLGFDGKEAIDSYRHEMAGRRKKPALEMPVEIAEGRTPSAVVVAGALAAGLLIYGVWYGVSSSGRTTLSQPPALPSLAASEPVLHAAAPPAYTPPPEAPAPVNETPPPPAPAPVAVAPAPIAAPTHEAEIILPAPTDTKQPQSLLTPTAVPTPPPPPAPAAVITAHLEIHALTPSWVFITDRNGDTVVDRVLKTGEVYKVPDQKGLSLTTGNGSGIMLMLDGRPLPKLSAPEGGNVIRGISLDSARLKSLPQSGD